MVIEPGPSKVRDPHTWISPHIAIQQDARIYEAIVQANPENEAYYTRRWNSLKNELTGLDEKYMNELANIEMESIFVNSCPTFF